PDREPRPLAPVMEGTAVRNEPVVIVARLGTLGEISEREFMDDPTGIEDLVLELLRNGLVEDHSVHDGRVDVQILARDVVDFVQRQQWVAQMVDEAEEQDDIEDAVD